MNAFKVNTAVILFICVALTIGGCTKENHGPTMDNPRQGPPETVFDIEDLNCFQDANAEVTEEEIEILLRMWNEEKLAHDVYLTFSELYKPNVFANIAGREVIHMDKVKSILDFYGIEAEYPQDIGVFLETEEEVVEEIEGEIEEEIEGEIEGEIEEGDVTFQELYNSLVEEGATLLVDALSVGVKIEEKDIVDLTDAMLEIENLTANPVILIIFDNLKCGSANHLRSFYNMLIAKGGVYEGPYYLTEEGEFEAILNGVHEPCKLD